MTSLVVLARFLEKQWPFQRGRSLLPRALSGATTRTCGSAAWRCFGGQRAGSSGQAPIDWHGRQRAGTRNVTPPASTGAGDAELLHLPLQRRAPQAQSGRCTLRRPPTTQPVSRSTPRMCSFSASASVVAAAVGSLA